MSNIVTFDAQELSVIEKSKAEQIKKTFDPMVKMLEGFEEAYSDVIKASEKGIDEDLTKRAKRLRLDIAKIRIEADKVRKSEKEEYLRAGQAIQGVFNILKWAVTDREEKLESIEKHFELQEQKRLEALQSERVELLNPYVEDAHERNLSDMDQDVWEAYLSTKKKEHEDRIEAEKKAEQERIEQERKEALLRKREHQVRGYGEFFEYDSLTTETTEDEFKGLVSDADKAKKAYEAEQEKIRKEREEAQKAAKKAEEYRKKREAEIEAERQKRQAEIEAERKKREKLEAEQKAREDAQKKAEAEAERQRKEAEKAPVKNRLTTWVNSFELPELPGQRHKVCDDIEQKFASFKKWAEQQIKEI